MNPVYNPFTPGAGTPPPELVGRGELLSEAKILVDRLKLNKPVRGLILNGLRGVGKTVVLNEIRQMALTARIIPIKIEINEDVSFSEELALMLKDALFSLDRVSRMKDKVRKSLVALRNFVGTLSVRYGEFGIDFEPTPGLADSGSLQHDLVSLFRCIGEAAIEQGSGVLLLIDEIQGMKSEDLRALIVMIHEVQQERLPIAVIGAGLPVLPGLAGNVKTYAERLFLFPQIGALSKEESIIVVDGPLRGGGLLLETRAANYIAKVSRGYPYFLQEWGYQVWNQGEAGTVSLSLVHKLKDRVDRRLDENFFRVRMQRLTPGEKEMVYAMAALAKDSVRVSELTQAMHVAQTALGPRRNALIQKGMLYSPAHGFLAFTVPLFGDYLRRNPAVAY